MGSHRVADKNSTSNDVGKSNNELQKHEKKHKCPPSPVLFNTIPEVSQLN